MSIQDNISIFAQKEMLKTAETSPFFSQYERVKVRGWRKVCEVLRLVRPQYRRRHDNPYITQEMLALLKERLDLSHSAQEKDFPVPTIKLKRYTSAGEKKE